MKPLPTTRFELPDGFSFGQVLANEPLTSSRRQDGWTADRQRDFLVAVAEGATVEKAAAQVGLSPQSAYGLRQRANGAVFALGWCAAMLLQRQRLADELTRRAFDGQVDTLTRADGSQVTRHRHDNRLALALLTRLDRHAEGRGDATTPELEAARLAAGEWQRYLDLVAADASPAQAGLFLAARAPVASGKDQAGLDALAPVLSLARADLYVRTRCGTADEIDASDLDPAQRAGWTAEQWARAEAAGLLALAPANAPSDAPAHNPKLPQDSPEDEEYDDNHHVWFDEEKGEWRTFFPPPPGAVCVEDGKPTDGLDYSRSLTPEEEAIVIACNREADAAWGAEEEAKRQAWFAVRAGPARADRERERRAAARMARRKAKAARPSTARTAAARPLSASDPSPVDGTPADACPLDPGTRH